LFRVREVQHQIVSRDDSFLAVLIVVAALLAIALGFVLASL
jgi:hypothetical protein